MSIWCEGKVAHLPEKGCLIVCSDLQGNMQDFRRLVREFRTLHDLTGDAYLLFLGDLIHGHRNYTQTSWPEWLGPFYADESVQIIECFLRLEAEFPGRVCCLLGNHEHSQIGGVWLENDSDRFEEDAGERSEIFKSFFSRLPLVALAPCGVVFSHACPSLQQPLCIGRSGAP